MDGGLYDRFVNTLPYLDDDEGSENECDEEVSA